MQHQWAEVTEKLGDIVGRGLRYGETPVNPVAAQLHLQLKELADGIEGAEDAFASVEATEAMFAATPKRLHAQPDFQGIRKEFDDLVTSLAEGKRQIEGMLTTIREDVVEFERSLGGSE